jgi:hypothetical protein
LAFLCGRLIVPRWSNSQIFEAAHPKQCSHWCESCGVYLSHSRISHSRSLRTRRCATSFSPFSACCAYDACREGNASKDLRVKRMTPRHLQLVIRGNDTLVLGTIASGGVLPLIHKSLTLGKAGVKKPEGVASINNHDTAFCLRCD